MFKTNVSQYSGIGIIDPAKTFLDISICITQQVLQVIKTILSYLCVTLHQNISEFFVRNNHFGWYISSEWVTIPSQCISFPSDYYFTEMSSVPTIKLNNGYEMPVVGLGTYKVKEINFL